MRVAESQQRRDVPIRFLGLWDTVEAYGVPVVGLKNAIDRWLWPLVFGDFELTAKVQQARHALSLDDERTTFHPLLWDELAEARAGRAGRIRQVWFAGVHSNVGGGYPEDQLSLVSLAWIMDEAIKNGLRIEPAAVQSVRASQSPFAKLYDSRKGLSSYYRYSPRRIEVPIDPAGVPILPVVHRSVVVRMTQGTDTYAPFTLPHQFWILDANDQLVPLSPKPAEMRLDAAKPPGVTLTSSDPDVVSAINKLARPDRQAIRLVWDTVFWRRCLYALTVSLTGLLVIYPLIAAPIANGMSWLMGADRVTRGPVADIVNAFSALIPSYVAPWKNALNEHPLLFFLIAISILASLAGSVTLERRIRDRARMAWDRQFRAGYLEWLGQTLQGVAQWAAGAVRGEPGGCAGRVLSPRRRVTRCGSSRRSLRARCCYRASVCWGRLSPGRLTSRTKIQSTFALSVARALRTERAIACGLSLSGESRRSSWPHGRAAGGCGSAVEPRRFRSRQCCRSLLSWHAGAGSDERGHYGRKSADSRLPDMCWASGIVLKKGHRYEITLTTPGDWRDREFQTDVLGMPNRGAAFHPRCAAEAGVERQLVSAHRANRRCRQR